MENITDNTDRMGYSIFKPYRGIDELFQGVQALIFQGVFVHFSDFSRGFVKVSRGFSPHKLASIVVFQALFHKISLSRGVYS